MTLSVYYHLGLSVPDLEQAMDELGRQLGLHWARPQTLDSELGALRFTYSREGPPHLELLEGGAGGPWDAAAGPWHHVGYWSDDVAAERDRLVAAGARLEVAGQGFTYHLNAQGLRVELVDKRIQPAFRRWLEGGDLLPHTK